MLTLFVMNGNSYGNRDEDISTHRGHLEEMVDYYARTASQYNAWHYDPTNNQSHNYAVRETFALMKKLGAKTLLDVCCGTGRTIKEGLAAGIDVRGIDISKDLIEAGIRELNVPADRFDHGDATCLPYGDQSYDFVCILGALHHTVRPRAIVAELLRVARRGLVISDEANNWMGGTKSLLIRMGIFDPVYRMIFRRAPRQHRRLVTTDKDGPAYVFSIEEVIPMVAARFPNLKCLAFYRFGKLQVCSYHLPRFFARQGVVCAWE
jgi:ubiquinone/menaquinone biosynthesis C-methylase UbiE